MRHPSLRGLAALPGLVCLLAQLPYRVTLFSVSIEAAPSERRLGVDDPPQRPPPRRTHRRVDAAAEDFYSTTHCVGENFGNDAWKYKSCQFRNLCFDSEAGEYVLFPSREELDLQRLLDARSDGLVTSSTLMAPAAVSLGTLTPAGSSSARHSEALRWFPRVETNRTHLAARGVEMLPEEAVLVPFHAFRATHAGHLLWDNGYPMFLLLSMFGLEQKQPLLVRHVVEEPLPGTCDESEESRRLCRVQFDKYLSLLGIPSRDWLWTSDAVSSGGSASSSYVCARFGAAGLGMVANRGLKVSGWTAEDYQMTHTVGHGALLWQFRSFLARNVLGDGAALPSRVTAAPWSVVVAWSSPSTALAGAYDAIRQQLATISSVNVRSLRLDEVDLRDQIATVAGTAIMICDCGGESIAAVPFLPRGASAIMYCPESDSAGGSVQWELEWDIINHAGYFQIHWFSTKDSVEKLVHVIQSEIDAIHAVSNS